MDALLQDVAANHSDQETRCDAVHALSHLRPVKIADYHWLCDRMLEENWRARHTIAEALWTMSKALGSESPSDSAGLEHAAMRAKCLAENEKHPDTRIKLVSSVAVLLNGQPWVRDWLLETALGEELFYASEILGHGAFLWREDPRFVADLEARVQQYDPAADQHAVAIDHARSYLNSARAKEWRQLKEATRLYSEHQRRGRFD